MTAVEFQRAAASALGHPGWPAGTWKSDDPVFPMEVFGFGQHPEHRDLAGVRVVLGGRQWECSFARSTPELDQVSYQHLLRACRDFAAQKGTP